MSVVKRWNGSTWVDVDAKPWKRWSGASWVDISAKPRYRWNGTTWVEIGGGGSPPATPTFVGATSNTTRIAGTGGTGSRVQAALPGGWAAGDFAVFAAAINAATGTFLVSTGWTVLPGSPTLPVTTNTSKHVVAYRELQAGDADPWFETSTSLLKVAGGVSVYRDAELDLEAHAVETVSGTTHTAPAVTTTGDNRRVVRCFTEKSSQNAAWSGYSSTLRTAAYDGTSGGVSLLMIDAEQVTAGGSGTEAATKSVASAQALMSTVALKGV